MITKLTNKTSGNSKSDPFPPHLRRTDARDVEQQVALERSLILSAVAAPHNPSPTMIGIASGKLSAANEGNGDTGGKSDVAVLVARHPISISFATRVVN